MVRMLVKDVQLDGCKYCEYACLSTDTKPTDSDLVTGSVCIEVDTGDTYLYDEEGSSGHEWVKVGGSNE